MKIFIWILAVTVFLPEAARAESAAAAAMKLLQQPSAADDVEYVSGDTLECAYNLDTGKIEVSKTGKDADAAALARCLAPAVAQMKYDAIEARWLDHLGIQQAWVVQKGVLQAKELSAHGLADATARDTWEVLATRELTASLGADSGRSIASETHSDPTVRALLGMPATATE